MKHPRPALLALSLALTSWLHADATYHPLAQRSFVQRFLDADQIQYDDDWAGVPSIIGYLGLNLSPVPGTPPTDILAPSDDDLTSGHVFANTTREDAGEGIVETDDGPRISIRASELAQAPNLVLHLDTRECRRITVSCYVYDADLSDRDATQGFAIQYRVGESGPFTNLPGAYLYDVTRGPSDDAYRNIGILLPPEAENQPRVQIRFLTTDALEDDEWIGVGEFIVSAEEVGAPSANTVELLGADATSNEATQDPAYVIVRRSGGNVGPLTVNYTVSGSATPDDYSPALGGTVVIPNGQESATLGINALRDSLAESDETVIITLDTSTDYTLGATRSLTLTLVDSGNLDYAPVRIHDVQGSSFFSPLNTRRVGVEAVVVGVFPALGGFYLQEEDADADTDLATSEGIFVQTDLPLPAVGELVRVVGTVTEFDRIPASETRLADITALDRLGNAPLPSPRALSLPFSPLDRQSSEGMRVTFAQPLYVADTARLAGYGQVVVSGENHLAQGTEVDEPGDAAQIRNARTYANRLIVDDGASAAPASPPYIFGGAHVTRRTLRGGDTVTGLTGVIAYTSDNPLPIYTAIYDYRLHPTEPPVFVRTNRRPAPPRFDGLRLVSLDVGVYANGDGAGGGFGAIPGAAGDATEFSRQRAHVIAQLRALRPDLVGLQGLENDGQGPASALQDIVNGLNSAEGGTVYAALALGGPVGGDALANGFLYRIARLTPVGNAAIDTNAVHERPPVVRSWRSKNGDVFTVALAHLKSRDPAGATGPDAFQADGQAYFNDRRIRQLVALRAFLAGNPTGLATPDPDQLILGNLNAYTREDPLAYLTDEGFENLLVSREGAVGYTVNVDGLWGRLHHAFASAELAAKVTGAAAWHVNADEPAFLDYNLENKSAAAAALNDGPTRWRAAAADPIVVGFKPVRPAPAPRPRATPPCSR